MLRKYETLFILKPDLPEEEFLRVETRLKGAIAENGGHEIIYQDWGKKKLAFPVKKYPKGNYVYFRYLSDGAAVDELERQLKVLDPVIRFLTVKLAERIPVEGYDFEGEAATIFPFGIKPREPEEPKAEEGTTEEAKTDEAKTEEPKTDEAKTEEPKAEEPKAEEPKAEEPKAEEQAEAQAEAEPEKADA